MTELKDIYKAESYIEIGEDRVRIREKTFRQFVKKHGATACGSWTCNECSRCIEDGVSDSKMQFECEEYRKYFNFDEAMHILMK